MPARDNILDRIRIARTNRTSKKIIAPDSESPIYHSPSFPLEEWFKQNLENLGGEVFIIDNINEVANSINDILSIEEKENIFCIDNTIYQQLKDTLPLKSELADFAGVKVSITACEALIAHLGSVLTCSKTGSGRRMNIFPETHIVLANKLQIVPYLNDALEYLETKYRDNAPSQITNITGPSRTADIEKTLVMGMHGPKRLIVYIL